MRRLPVCAVVAATASLLMMAGAARGDDGKEMDLLLDAIARVESRQDPGAVGDNGRAVGTYQIHRRYWIDGTKILGVGWRHAEARDPHKARQVVRAYLCHYGKGKTLLDMARIHNGGPRGHRKQDTLTYARKIAEILKSTV